MVQLLIQMMSEIMLVQLPLKLLFVMLIVLGLFLLLEILLLLGMMIQLVQLSLLGRTLLQQLMEMLETACSKNSISTDTEATGN